tara:strand:+ start:921 stop:1931 length:1011 start_codon:yes stop_codon:yes gene_type:complete
MSISLPNFAKIVVMILVFSAIFSCFNENANLNKTVIKVSGSKLDSINSEPVIIERFEKLFYNSTSEELIGIKNKYPYFFPNSYPESVWLDRLNDPIQREVFNETQKKYRSVEFLEIELFNFFKKNKKLNSKFKKPKVITVISDVDYRKKVILNDSLLLIGIDNYLGSNHRFYDGIPFYIREDFSRSNIISHIAELYALKIVPRNEFYTFIDKIIYHGKILYYKDYCLPDLPDRIKIGYSQEKMDWAIQNENFVWTYFIQNDILFDPDNNLNNRFIYDAPFSRFYLEIDNQSSEMIGKFIGWQIVKSYMLSNDVTLNKMINTNPIDIYNNSKYKPKR